MTTVIGRIGFGWLVCAVLLACGGADSAGTRVATGGGTLRAELEPRAPRVGSNALEIELRGAGGEPLEGAEVGVRVFMHAMGAMPAMGGPASVRELGDGRYRADFDLTMGGSWQVEIEAQPRGGAPLRAEGALRVDAPGIRLENVAAPVPGSPAAGAAGEFRIDPGRIQKIGVRVVEARREPLATSLRAAGRVVAEETTLADVSMKVRGWVRRIEVDAVGDRVERGQLLFRVYSPELYAAQQELLQALRSQQQARASGTPERADYLVRAARNRLRLWDVASADVDRVVAAGEPQEELPIRAPVGGYVVEKNVAQGSAFEPGTLLYRIAPLSRVWVEADVYEADLASVAVGQPAQVELPSLPGRRFEAQVAYVSPTLDPGTRTARVRLELPNPDLALRPAMYARVAIAVDHGERLVVPLSSVLHAGERSFVFRALGEGRFRPQAVTLGLRSGEQVEVVEGLAPGDPIVAAGTFLIASESRLRAALERW
jgi:Cu(I)/Ag(I) efflux system membrane fusion protein